MAYRQSKRLRNQQKRIKKAKKIKKLELQDAQGISRKKWKFTYSPKKFIWIKGITLLLIPVVYFVYSPLLAIVFSAYVALFYFAIGVEHYMNKSVIKSNHIRIPKVDSAIALLLIVVSLLGSVFGVSQERMGRFANTFYTKILTSLKNFGSLLTGQRQLLGRNMGFKFGTMPNPPDDFISLSEEFQALMPQMPNMGGGKPNFDLDISNVPIEFMFSQILSTIQTILIFATVGIGILSLVITVKKIKRFNKIINEPVLDGKIKAFSDEEINRLLSFGEIEEQI